MRPFTGVHPGSPGRRPLFSGLGRPFPKTIPLVLLWLVAVGSVSCAKAQVLEIGSDGEAVWRRGPAVHTADGVATIDVGSPPAPGGSGKPALSPAVAAVQEAIGQAALRQGLDARLVLAVARRESGFRPSAVSRRDAVGVMQLSEAAAADLGVDRFDLLQNIEGGATYLRRMIDSFGGDLGLALAAYNAGPEAVRRYRGVPPFRETRAYIAAVLADYGASQAELGRQR